MKILLTSAGRRGYLVQYFKQVIKDNGEVHVMNSSEHSTAMNYADRSVVSPLIYDENYIPFLLDYCTTNEINAIIPLFDVDLPIIVKIKGKFESLGIKVIVSNEQVVQICNDKWQTNLYLNNNGFKTPITFLSLEEALLAITKRMVNFPLIIKPRWGMGSLLVFEAENEEELVLFYKKIRRSISKTYLKFEAQQNLEQSVIIQEKILGQEHGLDIINNLNGVYQTTIVKRKISMRAGETDCAETIFNNELSNLGECLSKCLKHIGNLDIDVFLSERGIYILEMNARFGGGYPFSHLAGVNLPKAIVSWLKGENVDRKVLEPRIGVVGYKDLKIITIN